MLSARSVQYYRAVLRAALNQAIRWRLLTHNAAAATDPPRRTRTKVEAVTGEAARAILTTFQGHHLEALITVMLALGLRRGEALGLRWSDVDLERRRLSVQGQYQKVDGAWCWADLKTEESRRTLVLPAFVVDVLRAHRAMQIEQRLAVGPAWQDYDLVFPSAIGTPQDGVNVLHRFQDHLEKMGLPRMRLHALRHAAATVLLSQGVTLIEIKEILGHSRIGTTADIYAHVAPQLMEAAAEQMQRALGTEAG